MIIKLVFIMHGYVEALLRKKISVLEDFEKLCVTHVYLFDYLLQTVLCQIRADKPVFKGLKNTELNGILYIYS